MTIYFEKNIFNATRSAQFKLDERVFRAKTLQTISVSKRNYSYVRFNRNLNRKASSYSNKKKNDFEDQKGA